MKGFQDLDGCLLLNSSNLGLDVWPEADLLQAASVHFVDLVHSEPAARNHFFERQSTVGVLSEVLSRTADRLAVPSRDQASNAKLKDRPRLTISKIPDVPYDEASRLLTEAGPVRLAILMHLRNVSRSVVEKN